MKFFVKLFIFILVSVFSIDAFAQKSGVKLKVFPSNYELSVDGRPIKLKKISRYIKKVYVERGCHIFRFYSKGYHDKKMRITVRPSMQMLEIKLERRLRDLKRVALLKTGIQPKSVEFSPDGKYFAAALLEGRGVDLFSTETFRKVKRLTPPTKYAKKVGFVEIKYLPEKNEMWVSQMTSSSIHVFSLDNFEYKRTFPTRGVWSKVIAFTPDKKTAFVSNWESHNISFIDVDSHRVFRRVRVAGIPRGMVVSNDGKMLYVCIFSTGQIQKIDIKKQRVVKTLRFPKGAKRHIVMDRKKNRLYVTDMRRGSVYVINALNDRVIKEIRVDQKLNTGKLTPDGKYFIVSSRGPNNRESYRKKGPRFGKVYVIDTEKLKIRSWVWGRNQPTGLDISPDGEYLAFTNFLNHEVEVYEINLP